jgi:hypothetical protein
VPSRKRGRPRKIDIVQVKSRAYDVFQNLRGLESEQRRRLLSAKTADEITSEFFPPDCYLARKFPDAHFPAQLMLHAKLHRDYPKRSPEAQLGFIARYIAGAGVASPEYALKITRNILRT